MEFEELAVNYLDHDISDSEMSELNRFFYLSPELKDEIEDIAHLKNNLTESKIVLQQNDLVFLGDFGDRLTSSIVNSNKNHYSDIFNRNKKLSLLLLLLICFVAIIPSYFLFLKINLSPGSVANNSNSTKNVVIKEQSTDESSKSDNIPQNVTLPTPHKRAMNKSISENIQGKNELTGKISERNAVNSNELILSLQKELSGYQSKNDLLNQAVTEKKLGILLRDNTGALGESEIFLNKALAKFIKLNRYEQQAETLGELGKLEYARGNKSSAGTKYKECLNLLKSVNSPKYSYWEKISEKHN